MSGSGIVHCRVGAAGVAREARRARRSRRPTTCRPPCASRGAVSRSASRSACSRRSARARAGSSRSGRSGRSRPRRTARAHRRADPLRRDELVVVVRAVFALGRGRDEEPGVVAAGRADRREPVREQPQLAARRARAPRDSSRSANATSPAFSAVACRREARVVLDGHARGRVARRAGCRPPRSTRAPPRSGTPSPPAGRPCSALAARSSRPTTRASDPRLRVGGVDRAAGEHGRAGPNTARRVRSSISTCRSGRSDTRSTVAASRIAGLRKRSAGRRRHGRNVRLRVDGSHPYSLRGAFAHPDRAADLPKVGG